MASGTKGNYLAGDGLLHADAMGRFQRDEQVACGVVDAAAALNMVRPGAEINRPDVRDRFAGASGRSWCRGAWRTRFSWRSPHRVGLRSFKQGPAAVHGRKDRLAIEVPIVGLRRSLSPRPDSSSSSNGS